VVKGAALLAIVLFVAASCAQSQPSPHPLLIGAIYPLSGPQAAGGREELAGVRAAFDVALTTGALKTPVHLQVVNATTPEAASAAVDELVRDYHVPAILGTYGSTLSAAASARAEELKTVYWETGAVADPITARRHYVFRTVATGSALGRMAVTYTHNVLIPSMKLAAPRVVIVQVNDIYGQSVGGGELALAHSLGINVVDVIDYDTRTYDPNGIAARVASDRPDFLWDVSYLDDGVAIWQDLLSHAVPLKGAIGTSSAFCMPAFSQRLGKGSIGVYAADKPDGDISSAALSASGTALLARAQAAYSGINGGPPMTIPAVAGFVGGWTLAANVLSDVSGQATSDSIRSAALNVDVPVGDSINGGGVRFGSAGALDEGQNTRAAAVVGQWVAVGEMRIVYPPAYATGIPVTPSGGLGAQAG
jgi:branched-chain amino acid transport system substrate-binding protein